jgi:hypothetical protein
VIAWVSSPYGLAAAWQHSEIFWQQTFGAVGRHLPLLLAVAIVPAALRAYLIRKAQTIRHWELNLTEALLTVWRILICVVAVWAVLTPREWQTFKMRLRDMDRIQLTIQRLGAALGRTLHILLWELLLFAIALLLIHVLLTFIAKLAAQGSNAQKRLLLYKAASSFLRNLILAPLALIYIVAVLRQAFS